MISNAVYSKNEAKVHENLVGWSNSNLSQFEVTETGFIRYDIKKNRYVGNSTYALWRNEFHEQRLQAHGVNLLKEGCFIMPQNSLIKAAYQKFIEKQNYKTLFVLRNESIYTVFGIVTDEIMSLKKQQSVNKAVHSLHCELERYFKYHQSESVYKEIPHLHRAKEMLKSSIAGGSHDHEIIYDKAKFDGNLILTAKEQKCIEYLIFGMTQKRIAYMHGVTETSVRNMMLNIKRKLGFSESIDTYTMMMELKKRGVLGIYAEALTKETVKI